MKESILKSLLLKIPGISFIKYLKKETINLFFNIDALRFQKTLNVRYLGKIKFKILDFGRICRMRARTFEFKEPETLEWINSFSPNDQLLDVGANLGIYTLFAASQGLKVIAIEPEALNYAMLNLNIRFNNFNSLIKSFCISLHDQNNVDYLNISSSLSDWGAAQNNFNNKLDWTGKRTFNPIYSQGSVGLSIDYFLKNISEEINHIKVDVDGNEFLIMKGAKELLSSNKLKTILIELVDGRDDYEDTVKYIENFNFKLVYKGHASMYDSGRFSDVYNHIFEKINK